MRATNWRFTPNGGPTIRRGFTTTAKPWQGSAIRRRPARRTPAPWRPTGPRRGIAAAIPPAGAGWHRSNSANWQAKAEKKKRVSREGAEFAKKGLWMLVKQAQL